MRYLKVKENKRKVIVAGREGFEPPEARTSTVFKTAALDHSANSPNTTDSISKAFPHPHA